MKLGIIGTGNIGATLVRKLSAVGHDVKVANSRGPETIDPALLSDGARAATSEEAVRDVDAVILSTPFSAIAKLAPLIRALPAEVVVIDTANYYPHRDGEIAAIEQGLAESEWAAEQLGRPIAKAWNAITSQSFAAKGLPAGAADRIAIPVAADGDQERDVAMQLVDETGLDAVYSGTLAQSWRQQPGAPAYCTDRSRDELPAALDAADRARLPARRDLAIAAIMERANGGAEEVTSEFLVRMSRALFV